MFPAKTRGMRTLLGSTWTLSAALMCLATRASAQSAANGSEWSSYGADLANTRYRPLDQINAANFNKLEIVWRFKTDSLGPRPEFKLEGTPLMVKGVLYTTAGSRRAVVALDAATGELLWMHSEHEGERGTNAPRQLSGHGVAYWTDGKEERILYVTPGYRLVALDAKTGVPVPSFGKNGVVDLKQDDDQEIDLVTGEVGLHSTPIVAKNVVIVGAAHLTGSVPKSRKNVKGYVRGFDVRTGKRLWIFHTIPRPNESGIETWEKDSWSYTGNTGVWGQISVDEELGLVYLPVELPTGDYFGGDRPGKGLFGESLVAVDLQTGKRKWHYQLVHQAGLPVCLQSRNRRAHLAHRGASGGKGRCARGVVFAHTTVSNQTARFRQSRHLQRQSDQLHTGTPRGSGEIGFKIPDRAVIYAAIRE